jgi:hypothetical protein
MGGGDVCDTCVVRFGAELGDVGRVVEDGGVYKLKL